MICKMIFKEPIFVPMCGLKKPASVTPILKLILAGQDWQRSMSDQALSVASTNILLLTPA